MITDDIDRPPPTVEEQILEDLDCIRATGESAVLDWVFELLWDARSGDKNWRLKEPA